MNASVLCPGPGLVMYDDTRGPYDLTVGVNRAAGFTDCDLWVMLDARTFSMTAPRGRPVVICSADQWKIVLGAHPEAAALAHLDHTRFPFSKAPVGWHTKGLTVAIVAAYLRGARRIDCFGVDWTGLADWDGYHVASQKRSAKRWDAEKDLYGDLVDLLVNGDEHCVIRRVSSGKCQVAGKA